MGIYIYTMRASKIAIEVKPGEVHMANHYSYSYKDWLSSSWNDSEERRRNFIRNNAARHAEKAFSRYNGGYVVCCDKGKEDGATVYENVTQPVWADCNAFPGRPVGFLKRFGRRYRVVDRNDPYLVFLCNKGFHRKYEVIKDGKCESVYEPVPDNEVPQADRDRFARFSCT